MKAIVLLFALVSVIGCAKRETVVTPTVAPRTLTSSEIDADPLAILPTGFVGLLRAEIPAVAKSAMGPSLLALANRMAPLPPSSGFLPERDLDRIVLGLYSMQGADAAGVATGRFDPDAIKRAAAIFAVIQDALRLINGTPSPPPGAKSQVRIVTIHGIE